MASSGEVVERAASPPPLLAYTTSHQAQGAAGKKKGAGRSGSGKGAAGKRAPPPTKRFKRQAEPVLFDEKARHDFLTGFRKRKQARIEKGKQKAKERENEERRQMRSEARKARKEQAAENVRMEKVAYGGDSDDDDDEEEDGDKEPARVASPSAFDTEEHHTTVTVQEWDPHAEEEVPLKRITEAKKPVLKEKHKLPPSSRRAAKKAKSEEKAAAGKKPDKRTIEADQLSRMMDAEEAPLVVPEPVNWGKKGGGVDGSDPKKEGKFYYESKLDRAKAKAKIREDKKKMAEKYKEKRKVANILRRGGAKARALMRGDM